MESVMAAFVLYKELGSRQEAYLASARRSDGLYSCRNLATQYTSHRDLVQSHVSVRCSGRTRGLGSFQGFDRKLASVVRDSTTLFQDSFDAFEEKAAIQRSKTSRLFCRRADCSDAVSVEDIGV